MQAITNALKILKWNKTDVKPATAAMIKEVAKAIPRGVGFLSILVN